MYFGINVNVEAYSFHTGSFFPSPIRNQHINYINDDEIDEYHR